MGKKFGISFSWKRAVGISGLKNKVSRKIKIPLTSQGRQRKLGRMMGCRTIALIYILIFVSSVFLAMQIF